MKTRLKAKFLKAKSVIVFLVMIFFIPLSGLAISKKSAGKLWKQRIDNAFKTSPCPDIKVTLQKGDYHGPLIDTHIHIAPLPDGPVSEPIDDPEEDLLLGVNTTLSDYMCMMDVEGTKQVFAFFPVWKPITRRLIEVADQTMKQYPGRFIPFIMPPDEDNNPRGFPTVDARTLKKMLSIRPNFFRGYGEIGLYTRNGGAVALPPDSQRLRSIYPVLRKNKLLVYYHLGQGQQQSFERALLENPDISFIWHGDQLVHNEGGTQPLVDIASILEKHPNAFYGIDELYGDVWLLRSEIPKEQFLRHFDTPEPLLEKDMATWKEFIETHPDQVLWGSDRGGNARWSLDPEVAVTLNQYTRAFIGRLAPSVQEKFAYKNAEKLLGRSMVNNP